MLLLNLESIQFPVEGEHSFSSRYIGTLAMALFSVQPRILLHKYLYDHCDETHEKANLYHLHIPDRNYLC